MKIGIGLMASGKGSRMGENKLLMTIKGKTMIEHMIDKVSSLKAEQGKKTKKCKKTETSKKTEESLEIDHNYELEITIASCYEEILEIAEKNNLTAIYNPQAELGQSESIKLITKTLSHCDGIVFLPCDQIFLKWTSIDQLIQTFISGSGNFPVQASCKGEISSPVIFPKSFYKDLLKLKGDIGGRILLKGKEVNLIEIQEEELIDIDVQGDIEKTQHQK